MAQPEDDFESSVWDNILEGHADPIRIIYVVDPAAAMTDDDFAEVADGGGMWEMDIVHSTQEAKRAHAEDPCDLMILLSVHKTEIEELARSFPSLPLSVAAPGGWESFPSGYPPQVVVAQWAAPRWGEFMSSIETALSDESLDLIFRASHELLYSAPQPSIEIVAAASEELLARLAEGPAERFDIDPRVFEETVAELLSRMGYTVQLTPRSGDNGRDVIAALETPAAPILMLVECKRYAAHRRVGPEPITRLWSRLFDDRANLGMVVTTSAYTPAAQAFARSRGFQMSLKDGENFIEWVRSLRTGNRCKP